MEIEFYCSLMNILNLKHFLLVFPLMKNSDIKHGIRCGSCWRHSSTRCWKPWSLWDLSWVLLMEATAIPHLGRVRESAFVQWLDNAGLSKLKLSTSKWDSSEGPPHELARTFVVIMSQFNFSYPVFFCHWPALIPGMLPAKSQNLTLFLR